MPLNAKQVRGSLSAIHSRHEWVFFEEFYASAGAGFNAADSRIDAFAIGAAKGVEYARIAYEIKTSRSDFLREIKNPEKRRLALWLSNLYYFVTPKGLITIDELPLEAGLYEVWEEPNQGRLVCEEVRPAVWREVEPPNTRFIGSLARRIHREEESLSKIKEVQSLHEVARYAKEMDRLGYFEKLPELCRNIYGYRNQYLEELGAKLRAALKRADPYIEKVR